MNESKLGHYTLNMNPACSARLCVNGADARFCLLHSSTRDARLNEDIHI